jgi:hypothetical protein
MNPAAGFERKASSAVSLGAITSVCFVYSQLKNGMLDCGSSAISTPLMKILVPPPKDAHGIPLASSERNFLPLET